MKQRDIFIEAMQKEEGEERRAFLDAACGDDDELRKSVEGLFAEHFKDDSFFLDVPPPGLGATLAQSNTERPITEKPGNRIGPYHLLQQIGEGGMGVVYMAEQREPVQRRVALKIIKPGMDTRQVIARFEAERQALAIMDHPNIAKVFDAGSTDSGRPYFVMELVKGVPITRYCDEQRLTPERRLEMFMTVCQAVQHSHQKGIIHRDLKPSNVLVTVVDGKPVAKVIDFGLAKATARQLTDKTMFTQYGQVVGTVEYMSPEQAELNAGDIDTRSDIYSLGVLLYELLTGDTPFDKKRMRSAAFNELLRIIREEDPPRPSMKLSGSESLPSIAVKRRSDPRKLSAVVHGELDWIVMKALEKDRNRRYDTANGFAADIQHYLNDERVEACPPSAAYRFRKFARRNKVVLSTAAVLAVTLLLGVAGTTWQAIRAMRSADSERQARQEETRQRINAVKAQQRAEEIAEERRRLLAGQYVAQGTRLMKQGLSSRALPWLIEALRVDQGNQPQERIHRVRIASVLSNCPRLAQLWVQHEGEVDACFSTDGRRVVTASFDGTARVWDAETGDPISPTLRHADEVKHASFSPDGRRVVTASHDGTAQVWDVSTGQALTPRLQHKNLVRHALFSPDGRRVLTASYDRTAQVWDATSGAKVFPPLVHKGQLDHASFSPDGRHILAAGGTEARVWNAETGQPVSPSLIHKGRVYHASLSPDGGLVVTACSDGAHVWEASTGEPVSPTFGVGRLFHASFSPDGDHVVTTSVGSNTARIWEAKTGNPVTPPLRHQIGVLWASFSPDGCCVATASRDGTVRVWDAANGRQLTEPLEHNNPVRRVSFGPVGRRILSTSDDGSVRIWDLESAKIWAAPEFHHRPSGSVARISPHGRLVVTASNDGTARVWNAATGDPVTPPLEHDSAVLYATFSPNSRRVITASRDKTVKLWDVATGAAITPPLIHDEGVKRASFSPDGRYVITTSLNDVVRVWNSTTGDPKTPPLEHSSPVNHASFSPSGRHFVTCTNASIETIQKQNREGMARVWDVETGNVIANFKHARGSMYHASFSPDGRRLVTSQFQGHVCIWDVARGKPAIAIVQHSQTVRCAFFSPDGRFLVSASEDKTARVWDAETGEAITPPLEHAASVNYASFSADGQFVVTASSDTTARVWDARTGQPITPPLAHGGRLTYAFLSPDGDRLMTHCVDGTARVWHFAPPDNRPLSELVLIGKLLSGKRVEPSGVLTPVERHSLHETFERLQAEFRRRTATSGN